MSKSRDVAAPALFLLCGLPGSGKTTLARQLEREQNGVRLNLDEWTVPLFGQHMAREVFDARVAHIKALQWNLAERLLRLGVNVVLDWGFWQREERWEYRRRAEAVGAAVALYFLDIPKEELLRRLGERNANLPEGTFELDEVALTLFESRFERPTEDENQPIVSIKTPS